MSGVTLNKVIKRYGDVQVIHGIDLRLRTASFAYLSAPRAVENRPF